MRAYYFGNMYLSSIQQGIQAAHATAEMFLHYAQPKTAPVDESGRFDASTASKDQLLWEWAKNHKTMILLNGGYSASIDELVQFFTDRSPYPWAPFYEEQASLNGALTTVAIILPEKIYLTAAAIRNGVDGVEQSTKDGSIVVGVDNDMGFKVSAQTTYQFSKWEYDLITKLNTFGFAK